MSRRGRIGTRGLTLVIGAILAGCDDAPPPGPTPLAPRVIPHAPAPPTVAPPTAAPLAEIPSDAGAATAPLSDAGSVDASSVDARIAEQLGSEEPVRVVDATVVEHYLAFLHAFVPAAEKIVKDNPTADPRPATATRGAPPAPTVSPQVYLARAGVRKAALQAALIRERDAAGLNYQQLEAVTRLVMEVMLIRNDSPSLGRLRQRMQGYPRHPSAEVTQRISRSLDAAEDRNTRLQNLDRQRRQWGDAAVDAVLAHLDELRPLAQKHQNLARF